MMQEVDEPLIEHAEDCDSTQDRDNADLEVSINHDPPSSPDPTATPERYTEMTKRKVIQNLCVLCFSMFLFFMGFMALSNLQSTMNSAKGLGTDSQAAIYITSMLSALLLPELVVKNIGCKRGLILAVSCSLPYIAANFYPRWETLMPTAVLLGLSAGPLTASQSFYVNEMARRYYNGPDQKILEQFVSSFYGFNSFATENTQIWGNLISYYVLRPSMVPISNQTGEPCGIHFINYDVNRTNDSNLQPPTDGKREVLVGIFLLCGIISVLVMTFAMDHLGNEIDQDDSAKGKWSSIGARLVSALKQAMKYEQLLLIPLSIYCGLATSFYASDFTQAFIACSWGVHHVGFVTICFGVCGALMSILVGPLVKISSQMVVILFAAFINVVTCTLLFFWHPTPDTPVIYFLFAGAWGMTDAIWWSQIAALYGLMFPDDREAAFSNFFFWSFLGYFLSYSYANYFTVFVKINIMLIFLIVGISLYSVGQFKIKCFSHRRDYVVIADAE